MSGDIAGKTALITGASRGLGRALALKLAEAGAQTVLVSRTQGALEELDDVIRAAGCPAPVLAPQDITDTAGIEKLAAAIGERFGALDIYAGIAGTAGDGPAPLPHTLPKDVHHMFAVNAFAHYHFLRCLDPLLRRATDGATALIPFDADMQDNAPAPFLAGYTASKAAARQFTGCYAEESAAFGVRVICPALPPMRSALRSRLMPGEPAEALDTPEQGADKCMDALRRQRDEAAAIAKRAVPKEIL